MKNLFSTTFIAVILFSGSYYLVDARSRLQYPDFETYASDSNLNFELKIRCVFNPVTGAYVAIPQKKERWWSGENDSPYSGENNQFYNPWLSTSRSYQEPSPFYEGSMRALSGMFSSVGNAMGKLVDGVGYAANNLLSGYDPNDEKFQNVCNKGLISHFSEASTEKPAKS